MQRRNPLDSAGLPPALLKTAPRHVQVNLWGGIMLVIAAALVVVGMGGGIVLGREAGIANRRVSLFASERIVTAGDVIQLRKRGGDEGNRITAHYRYTARGQEFTGETRLRRDENERYAVGSPIAVWYLKTEPKASWLDGYAPRPQAAWPATAVPFACGVVALTLIWVIRRQWNLLAYGRPAMATVTKVEKKKGEHGTYWLVHYEFTTLSSATRHGKYQHAKKKDVPAIGATLPIVYDRDNSFRHNKYPMSLVRLEA